jgi:hypothetical protein
MGISQQSDAGAAAKSHLSAAITRQGVVPEALMWACDGLLFLMMIPTAMAKRSSTQREKRHSLQQHFGQLVRR